MSNTQYGAVSFAPELATQERPVKLAALEFLNAYFRKSRLTLHDDGFWAYVEDFEEETEGLDTPSFEDILRLPIPDEHRESIERLGFRVGTLYPVT